MDYRNADGSLAEICGNGVRCFAKYCFHHGILTGTTAMIQTRAGHSPRRGSSRRCGHGRPGRCRHGRPAFSPRPTSRSTSRVTMRSRSTSRSTSTVWCSRSTCPRWGWAILTQSCSWRTSTLSTFPQSAGGCRTPRALPQGHQRRVRRSAAPGPARDAGLGARQRGDAVMRFRRLCSRRGGRRHRA